jgi:hypothetical protein
MHLSMNDEEAKRTGIPTPERYAELQKERYSKAVQALTWLDEETMQKAVAEALAIREDDQAHLDYLEERDELGQIQRERKLKVRYETTLCAICGSLPNTRRSQTNTASVGC